MILIKSFTAIIVSFKTKNKELKCAETLFSTAFQRIQRWAYVNIEFRQDENK
jgi:hypothetical protein